MLHTDRLLSLVKDDDLDEDGTLEVDRIAGATERLLLCLLLLCLLRLSPRSNVRLLEWLRVTNMDVVENGGAI